jgi:hypothetical protein
MIKQGSGFLASHFRGLADSGTLGPIVRVWYLGTERNGDLEVELGSSSSYHLVLAVLGPHVGRKVRSDTAVELRYIPHYCSLRNYHLKPFAVPLLISSRPIQSMSTHRL